MRKDDMGSAGTWGLTGSRLEPVLDLSQYRDEARGLDDAFFAGEDDDGDDQDEIENEDGREGPSGVLVR